MSQIEIGVGDIVLVPWKKRTESGVVALLHEDGTAVVGITFKRRNGRRYQVFQRCPVTELKRLLKAIPEGKDEKTG